MLRYCYDVVHEINKKEQEVLSMYSNGKVARGMATIYRYGSCYVILVNYYIIDMIILQIFSVL